MPTTGALYLESEHTIICVLCEEIFDVPKLLHCGHRFCRDCLLGWLQTSHNDACPICRCTIVDARKHGGQSLEAVTDGFPTDLVIKAKVEAVKLLNNPLKCICGYSEAVALCLQCGDALCKSCCESHKKVSKTKDHDVENLKSLAAEKLATYQPVTCAEHKKEVGEVYCLSHGTSICVPCATTTHRNCPELVTQQNHANQLTKELTLMNEALTEGVAKADTYIAQLTRHDREFQNDWKAFLNEQQIYYDRLKATMDARFSEIQKCVSESTARSQAVRQCATEKRCKMAALKIVTELYVKFNNHKHFGDMITVVRDRFTDLGLDKPLTDDLPLNNKFSATTDPEAIRHIEYSVQHLWNIILTSKRREFENQKATGNACDEKADTVLEQQPSGTKLRLVTKHDAYEQMENKSEENKEVKSEQRNDSLSNTNSKLTSGDNEQDKPSLFEIFPFREDSKGAPEANKFDSADGWSRLIPTSLESRTEKTIRYDQEIQSHHKLRAALLDYLRSCKLRYQSRSTTFLNLRVLKTILNMIQSNSSSEPSSEADPFVGIDQTDITTVSPDIADDAERESLSSGLPRQEDYSDCSDASASDTSSSSSGAWLRHNQFATRKSAQTCHGVLVCHCEDDEIAFEWTEKTKQTLNEMNKNKNRQELNIISLLAIPNNCWEDGILKARECTNNFFIFWTPSFDKDDQCEDITKALLSLSSKEVNVSIILYGFLTPEDRQKCREKRKILSGRLVMVYTDTDSFHTNFNQRIFYQFDIGTSANKRNKKQCRTRSSHQRTTQIKQKQVNLQDLGSSLKNRGLGGALTPVVTSDVLTDTTAPVTDDSLRMQIKVSTNKTECTTSKAGTDYEQATASISVQNAAGHQVASVQRGVKESSNTANTRSILTTASSKRLASFTEDDNGRNSSLTSLCSKVTEDVEAPTMETFIDLTVNGKATEKDEKCTVLENSGLLGNCSHGEQTPPNYPSEANSTTLNENSEASQRAEKESALKAHESSNKQRIKQVLVSSSENGRLEASLRPDVTPDVSFPTVPVTDVSFNRAPVTEFALPMQKEVSTKRIKRGTSEVKDYEQATASIADQSVASHQNTTVHGLATDESLTTASSKRLAASTQGAKGRDFPSTTLCTDVPDVVKAPKSTSSMETFSDLPSKDKARKQNETFIAPDNCRSLYKCSNDEQTPLNEKSEVSQLDRREPNVKNHESNGNLRSEEENCTEYLNLATSSSGLELNTNCAPMSSAVSSMNEQTHINYPLEAKSTLNENSETSQLVGEESDLKNHHSNNNLRNEQGNCTEHLNQATSSSGLDCSTNREPESLTTASTAEPKSHTVKESDAKNMDNALIPKGTTAQPNKDDHTDDTKTPLMPAKQSNTRSNAPRADEFFEDSERTDEQKQKVGLSSLGKKSSDKILDSVKKFEVQVPDIDPTAQIFTDDTKETEKKSDFKSVRTENDRNYGFANVEPTIPSKINDTCEQLTLDYQELFSCEESAVPGNALYPCLKNRFEGLKGPDSLLCMHPNPYSDDASIDLKQSKIKLKPPVQEMQPFVQTTEIYHPSPPMPNDMMKNMGGLCNHMLQTAPESAREHSKETQTSDQTPPSTTVQPGAIAINIHIGQADLCAIGANNKTSAPVRPKAVADSETTVKNVDDDQLLVREPLLTDDPQTAQKHDTCRKDTRRKQNTPIKKFGAFFCFRSKQGKSARRSMKMSHA